MKQKLITYEDYNGKYFRISIYDKSLYIYIYVCTCNVYNNTYENICIYTVIDGIGNTSLVFTNINLYHIIPMFNIIVIVK